MLSVRSHAWCKCDIAALYRCGIASRLSLIHLICWSAKPSCSRPASGNRLRTTSSIIGSNEKPIPSAVESSFAWLGLNRQTSDAMIDLAATRIMLIRMRARTELFGQPLRSPLRTHWCLARGLRTEPPHRAGVQDWCTSDRNPHDDDKRGCLVRSRA